MIKTAKARKLPVGSIKLPVKLVARHGGARGRGAYLLAADGKYIAGVSEGKSARYMSIMKLMASEVNDSRLLTPHAAREWIAQQV